MDQSTAQELLKKIEELQQKVEALEAWKTQKESQQLTYPLDYVSQQIIAAL